VVSLNLAHPVLYSDVQIAFIWQVVPQLVGVKQRWGGKNKSSYTQWHMAVARLPGVS